MPSLGKDLESLRKKQDLSIKDVQDTTKLPPAILESIENDLIFENTDSSNATYTRSYVRSYAKAIGIEEQKIIQALNEVETGSYDGSLLGKKAKKPTATNTSDEETEKNDQLEWVEEPLEKNEDIDEAKEAGEDEKTEAGVRSDEAIFSMPKRPSSDDWDWVQVGYQANAESSGRSGKMGLLAVVLLIIIIALCFWLYSNYSDGKSPESNTPEIEDTEEPASSSDSLRQALIQDSGQNGRNISNASGSLPDTLTIGIIAANDELKPVRVYTDILGKRNPYWVAKGDTIHLNFVDSVRIYAVDQYDLLQLVLNNQPIQNFYEKYYNSEQNLLELSRTDFEAKPEWRRPL